MTVDQADPKHKRAHAGQSATSQPGLRPDIQAMRALAVGSVLLYHLWPNRLSGGYVGVDVFFVISGFLITSHLVSELDRRGTVRLAAFWSRRALRLLPASLTVLLVSAIGTVAFVPESQWRQFLTEIGAAALYVENWQLARSSVDYLASDNLPSPVQHFWSLSAEEQFYLGLPILVVTAAWVGRRSSSSARRVLFGILAGVTAASLVASALQTAWQPSLAYYSTLTRAWEFLAGGLLAMVAAKGWLGRRTAQPGTTWIASIGGLAAVLYACFWFTDQTPFPGLWALIPVLGSLAMIAAGPANPLNDVGRFAPIAFVGRVSYAIYLWHWPMIVLLPAATGHPLTTVEKLGILVATLVLAWASTKFIEEPIRFSPRLGKGRRPRTIAAGAAAGMAAVLAFVGWNAHALSERDEAREALVAKVAAGDVDCLGAEVEFGRGAPACVNDELGDLLVPDPSIAMRDDDNESECWGKDDDGDPRVCTLGETENPSKRLIAVGDSHNNTLIGAYREIAAQRGWTIDVAGHPACYLTARKQQAPQADQGSCDGWRADIGRVVADGDYDGLVVTHSRRDAKVIPESGESREDAEIDGLVEAWRRFGDLPILAIVDNPSMPRSNEACVAEHRLEAQTECAVPRDEALENFDGTVAAAEQLSNVTPLELTDLYCDDDVCPPVLGNVLVYRDTSHVTATWARTMVPYFDAGFEKAFGNGE